MSVLHPATEADRAWAHALKQAAINTSPLKWILFPNGLSVLFSYFIDSKARTGTCVLRETGEVFHSHEPLEAYWACRRAAARLCLRMTGQFYRQEPKEEAIGWLTDAYRGKTEGTTWKPTVQRQAELLAAYSVRRAA